VRYGDSHVQCARDGGAKPASFQRNAHQRARADDAVRHTFSRQAHRVVTDVGLLEATSRTLTESLAGLVSSHSRMRRPIMSAEDEFWTQAAAEAEENTKAGACPGIAHEVRRAAQRRVIVLAALLAISSLPASMSLQCSLERPLSFASASADGGSASGRYAKHFPRLVREQDARGQSAEGAHRCRDSGNAGDLATVSSLQ
jgi:hypothetical protein